MNGSGKRSTSALALNVGVILLLGLFAAWFHREILFSSSNEVLNAPDIGFYFQWLHRFARDEILAGRLPLWNPYNYCGSPFAANPQATVFYPPSGLHLLVPVIQAEKYLIVLHTWMAGTFMWMFLRQIGTSRAAALVGALPFMLGNYVMANVAVGHLTMLYTVAWLPLIMLFYERAISSGQWRWLVWTGASLGVQALAGEPQNSYYTALLVTVYGLVRRSWRRHGSSSPSIVSQFVSYAGGLVLIAIVAFGTAAIQLFPTAEFAAQSDRSAATYEFATFFSAAPIHLFELLMPWRAQRTWGVGVSQTPLLFPQSWEIAGYVGILTLIMVGASFLEAENRPLRAARILLLVAAVLMLGHNTPIYRALYEMLPGLNLFRIPTRAVVIAHWSLAVMGGCGANWVFHANFERWRRWKWRVWGAAALVAVLAGLLAVLAWPGLYRLVYTPSNTVESTGFLSIRDGIVLRISACLLMALASLLMLRWVPRSAALGAVILVIVADLHINRPEMPIIAYQQEADPSYTMYRQLPARHGSTVPYRVDLPSTWAITNAALGARIECVNGYSPLCVGRVFRFVHWMRGQTVSDRTRHEFPESIYQIEEPFPLRIMNVRVATRWNPRTRQFTTATDEVTLPRAWVVEKAEVLADEDAALHRLKDRAFDPARTVILERPPRIAMSEGLGATPRVNVVRNQPGELELHTDTIRDGYLVLSEVFYPGWKAVIDGQPVELERADDVITAMPLPAGKHRIVYRYAPSSVRIGAWCSGCTWLFVVGCTIGLARWNSRSRKMQDAGCCNHGEKECP